MQFDLRAHDLASVACVLTEHRHIAHVALRGQGVARSAGKADRLLKRHRMARVYQRPAWHIGRMVRLDGDGAGNGRAAVRAAQNILHLRMPCSIKRFANLQHVGKLKLLLLKRLNLPFAHHALHVDLPRVLFNTAFTRRVTHIGNRTERLRIRRQAQNRPEQQPPVKGLGAYLLYRRARRNAYPGGACAVLANRQCLRKIRRCFQRGYMGQISLRIQHVKGHAPIHGNSAARQLRPVRLHVRLGAVNPRLVPQPAWKRRLSLDHRLHRFGGENLRSLHIFTNDLYFHALSLPSSLLMIMNA